MIPDTSNLRLGMEYLLDDRGYLFRLIYTNDWDAQLEADKAVQPPTASHPRSACSASELEPMLVV
jgi:hypothetical protein